MNLAIISAINKANIARLIQMKEYIKIHHLQLAETLPNENIIAICRAALELDYSIGHYMERKND